MSNTLTPRQRQVLDVIVEHQNEHGYPPSVREIGQAIGLRSPATVKAHLDNLRDAGYLIRDPAKPRAIQIRYEGQSGAAADRRPVRHVPLVGDVAAGTDVLASENIDELIPVPSDLTGDGELFMLRVRGESMIDLGIFDGDFVVCHTQSSADRGSHDGCGQDDLEGPQLGAAAQHQRLGDQPGCKGGPAADHATVVNESIERHGRSSPWE